MTQITLKFFDFNLVRKDPVYDEVKKRDRKNWLSRRSKKGWENRATKKTK